jgi:multidrug resistance efflux pump
MAIQSPARPTGTESPGTPLLAPEATQPGARSTPRPHRPPRRVIVPVLLVAIGLTVWLFNTLAPSNAGQPITASGTVEADEVLLGVEVVGRISAIAVREGQYLNQGDVVARLDDSAVQLQFRQAEPTLRQQVELQLDKYVIRAPIAGTITRIPAHAGEVISPGQTIATLADLSTLRLTVYVLETEVGQIALRQPVIVTADPFPGREFAGVVTSIKQRAEFTPRNVQTQRDRQNLVFGVKVLVENQAQLLKPGLPVDVRFVQE